ncbi:MAG TPA: hypothetical protein VF757_01980 [Sphingomicrobium sp.]
MPRGGNRGGRNNNPSGRNQYSDWGVMEIARERPFAAAAAAAGAAAAGLFLWSRRAQISDQISNLSDQIGEWTEGMRGGSEMGLSDDTAGLTTSASTGSRATGTRSTTGRGRSTSPRRGMSETGGGNASLGARTGGGGMTSSASGRGRAQQTTP